MNTRIYDLGHGWEITIVRDDDDRETCLIRCQHSGKNVHLGSVQFAALKSVFAILAAEEINRVR